MHTTFWGSQKQFIYSSSGDDGQVQQDKGGKHSQTGARISHVEVMRYEQTINHYTTTSENAASFPHPVPNTFNTFNGSNVESYPVSSHSTISRQHESPQEDEEMEEIVRAPSPSTSLELLDSKTRFLFVHCMFPSPSITIHFPRNRDGLNKGKEGFITANKKAIASPKRVQTIISTFCIRLRTVVELPRRSSKANQSSSSHFPSPHQNTGIIRTTVTKHSIHNPLPKFHSLLQSKN